MAGKSSKKQAQRNAAILRQTYLLVLPVLGLSFLRRVLQKGSWLSYVPLHFPAAACLYMLEKSGRPQYDEKGQLVREGFDLKQPGLTEYMFDVIYLSIFADVGHIALGTLKLWYVLLLVPVYLAYRAKTIAGPLISNLLGSRSRGEPRNDAKDAAQATKSKRMAKREKNADRVQFKYR
ncbi:LAMI_0G17128g1_1 [Lachancea mirantina]|uniref:LAMI_0G17128g1_1 n=1 Tax=Lachancea mirantina TaxID=1230905 RepID=A0A1G4KCQ5_9SACH|nr:LAMI_0G17128g1_1 [Lachancea mirantina]